MFQSGHIIQTRLDKPFSYYVLIYAIVNSYCLIVTNYSQWTEIRNFIWKYIARSELIFWIFMTPRYWKYKSLIFENFCSGFKSEKSLSAAFNGQKSQWNLIRNKLKLVNHWWANFKLVIIVENVVIFFQILGCNMLNFRMRFYVLDQCVRGKGCKIVQNLVHLVYGRPCF